MDLSKESVAVLDHSKIGVRNLYKIIDLNEINIIICDEKYPLEWWKTLENNNAEWIYK